MLVGRRMTRDPRTVSPEDTLTRAADIMRESRINHLPVVDGGRLVGIVSDTDLRNASIASGPARPAEAPGGAAGRVREVMKREVWSLTPEDSVEDALLIISRRKFGALPVLSDGRLVGIITKIDLLNAIIDVLNLDDVGLRIEVTLPRTLAGFERLVGELERLSAGVHSCIVTPRSEAAGMVAIIRLETIDGPRVIAALRALGYEVAGRADFS